MQPLPAGFTASGYEIYLGVDDANPTLLTTLGNVLTYDYDIVDPSYVSLITNLNFYVKAVITQTGGATSITTGASNEENLNTYTYATAPRNFVVDYVINDVQVPGDVEVAFTWENVLNPGLGFQEDASACVYYWKVFAVSDPSGTALVSGTVPYDPAQAGNRYNVLTSYRPLLGITYELVLYLQTPNTNGSHELLNGLSVTSNDLVPVEVPFIFDILVFEQIDGSFIVSFKVLSNVLLAPQAVFVTSTSGVPEAVTPFSMANVPYIVDSQSNYVYTVSEQITPVILPSDYLGFGIFASNTAGIGFRSRVRP
jgi:hypothetical protein